MAGWLLHATVVIMLVQVPPAASQAAVAGACAELAGVAAELLVVGAAGAGCPPAHAAMAARTQESATILIRLIALLAEKSACPSYEWRDDSV